MLEGTAGTELFMKTFGQAWTGSQADRSELIGLGIRDNGVVCGTILL